MKEIHCGRAQKSSNELIGWLIEKLHRRAHLHHLTCFEHDNLIRQGHRFDLIMGDIDGCCSQLRMEPRNFHPCVMPQGRIEIGERFIKQKHIGIADNRPTNRHPLALPT